MVDIEKVIRRLKMWRDARSFHISNIYEELHKLNEAEKEIEELEKELINGVRKN